MSGGEDDVPAVEEITFNPDGSSRHVWRLQDGSVLSERTFKVSPVLFLKSELDFGLETAREAGIVSVVRRMVPLSP